MSGPAISCLVVTLVSTALPAPQFDADARPKTLQTFRVAGLEHTASGTVYPAEGVEQGGMPLGGLGTGYLCLDTDGHLGKCSVFNRLPAPIVLGKPFLVLTLGNRRMIVATGKDGTGDVKQIHYSGHFPVADVRYELDAPVGVELRAFSPFPPHPVQLHGRPTFFRIAAGKNVRRDWIPPPGRV